MIHTMEELQEFFEERRTLGIQLGLERLEYLLAEVKHPERNLPVIHIAGTNGKGSTLAYLRQVLMDAGYSVGSFVSPGLPTLLDHILYNEKRIEVEEFLVILNKLLPIIEKMDAKKLNPSEYEILMVVTLLYFKDNVDIALIETAMGGRDDITNCVVPLLSIITNISYDHTQFLGPTLTDIAQHKAGIIKSNTPLIIGEMSCEALTVIKETARRKKAPLYQFGKEFRVRKVSNQCDKEAFLWERDKGLHVELSMIGVHQIQNASLALMACALLKEQGFHIEESKMLESFRAASLSYRMEKIASNPAIYIDGAHNEAGIEAFISTVDTYFQVKNVVIITGVFKDKNVKKMLELLTSKFGDIYMMTFNHARAMQKSDYEKIASKNSGRIIEKESELFHMIEEVTITNKTLIFVGSLHFVSHIKQLLGK